MCYSGNCCVLRSDLLCRVLQLSVGRDNGCEFKVRSMEGTAQQVDSGIVG